MDNKNNNIEETILEENKTSETIPVIERVYVKDKPNYLKWCLTIATAFALGGLSVFSMQRFTPSFQSVVKSTVAPNSSEEEQEEIRINAISKAKDSVVSVVGYTNKNNTQLSNILSGSNGSLQASSSGSGIIYRKDNKTSYIVTNQHVISGADKLDVILSNGTVTTAELVGSDIWTDLAVLKISSEHVTTVMDFADSDKTAVGQTAIAIGSPLGVSLANTVTKGIVSAIERQIPMDIDRDGTYDWYQTVMQTDAAINSGNSGGALINSSGQLLGVNQLKISHSTNATAAEGIGFVIPSNEVKLIIGQLETNGKVDRPALGVQLVDVSSLNSQQLEETLKYPNNKKGVVIKQVEDLSAAQKAGLKANDIIIKINDTNIEGVASLRKYIFEKTKIGDTIHITYYRDGKEYTVELTLGQLN